MKKLRRVLHGLCDTVVSISNNDLFKEKKMLKPDHKDRRAGRKNLAHEYEPERPPRIFRDFGLDWEEDFYPESIPDFADWMSARANDLAVDLWIAAHASDPEADL